MSDYQKFRVRYRDGQWQILSPNGQMMGARENLSSAMSVAIVCAIAYFAQAVS